MDHTSYTCQLVLYPFSFALRVQNGCKKNLCNGPWESKGSNCSSWDFRCLNQTQRDTAAKHSLRETVEDNGAKHKEHGLSLPIALMWRFGQNRISKNASRWLIGSDCIICSKYITCDQWRDLGERGARIPTHSHHYKAKLPSRTPMELHCIYLGRARTGAWTKTSQDQSDSTTGKLQTVPLCYPAAVSTARVCQDLRGWK